MKFLILAPIPVLGSGTIVDLMVIMLFELAASVLWWYLCAKKRGKLCTNKGYNIHLISFK